MLCSFRADMLRANPSWHMNSAESPRGQAGDAPLLTQWVDTIVGDGVKERVSAKAKEAVGKMFGSSSSTGTNTEAGHAQDVQPSSTERGSGK
ncbi:hypothetical protein HaLaN_11395 [Haematococcus lacustris]|uniref:Uncharacterized protein n=1 Tax=Haematococcus lacustris TaxID=44745 RepID=A0A699YY50_HAELA|nr:hypothetical protein HaLaN_11395 [Haematococcus lacustris]